MKLESGKTYLIKHQRKGTFAMRVTAQNDTWTSGVVAGGKTTAKMHYNEQGAGEEVTCRTAFIISATEQP